MLFFPVTAVSNLVARKIWLTKNFSLVIVSLEIDISWQCFWNMINRFRIFKSSAALEPDKASVVAMGTFALHNILRLKSRDSYTRKGSSDKIRNNISLLQANGVKIHCQTPWMILKEQGKQNLNAEKIPTSLLVNVIKPGQVRCY